MDFDLENPLTSLKEPQSDTIPYLFASESDHMPSANFLLCFKTSDFHVSFRQEALSLILQAQYSCNNDPFLAYLAVNYMDRFTSRKQIPQGKWVLRLLVICCISLAAKMKNTHFSIVNFQREEGFFIFDPQTVNRMEILILDALNWRMRSITPFSFLKFFINLFQLNDSSLPHQALKDRATDLIFRAHKEIKLLEFKPSIIAASALLVASQGLFPVQFPSFRCSISSCQFVNKEKLLKCFNAMQEMVEMECYRSMFETDTMSSTRTPLNVLNRNHTKSESETSSNTGFSGSALPEKRETKRRKMNGYVVHLSQTQQC